MTLCGSGRHGTRLESSNFSLPITLCVAAVPDWEIAAFAESVSPHRCCTESAAPSSVCSEQTPAWRHFLPHCYPPTSLPLSGFRPGSVTRQLCSFPSAYSRTDRSMSYRASTKAGGGVGWKYIAVHCPGRPGSSGDHKDPMKAQCSRCWGYQSSKVVSTRFPRSGSEV